MTMSEGSGKMASMCSDPTARLTDDTLANIISRVPYKSTCCCKCVSTRWRDLISHPDHGKKMPQSLVGFFHYSLTKFARCFTNVSGKGDPLFDPSLSFLSEFGRLASRTAAMASSFAPSIGRMIPRSGITWFAIQPLRNGWSCLAPTGLERRMFAWRSIRLSPPTSMCEFIRKQFWVNKNDFDPYEDECIAAVLIYSSKTGVWSHKDDAWTGRRIQTPPFSESVLFRGVLYLCAFGRKLVALDVEENNWKVIPLPRPQCRRDISYDIYLSQGQLHFAHIGDSELSIWVLEDPGSEKWTLKHNVSHLRLVGTEDARYAAGYSVFSIHPDRSLIFLVCKYEEKLISYDMDSRELRFLCQVGRDGEIQWSKTRYLPYVPLYSELLADDGH